MSAFGDHQAQARYNVGDSSLGLIDDSQPDPYRYQGSYAMPEQQKDIYDLAPDRTVINTLGKTQYEFQTVRNCDRLLELYFILEIPSPNVVGGTFKRLVDGAGIQWFEAIEVRTSTQLLYTVYPNLRLHEYFLRSIPVQNRPKHFARVGLGLTAAQRTTLAQGTQTFTVPVPVHWHDLVTKSLIVPSLNNGLYLHAIQRPTSELVETDGAAPVAPAQMLTVTNPRIRCVMLHTDEERRAEDLAMVTNGASLDVMFREELPVQPQIVPLGATTASIDLTGLNIPVQELIIRVRRVADLQPFAMRPFNFSAMLNPTEFEIKSNQLDVVRRQRLDNWYKDYVDVRHYAGHSVVPAIVFAEDPHSPDVASGHLDFQFIQNATLNLYWQTAIPEAYEVQVIAVFRNWLQQASGTFRRVWVV